MVRGEAYKENDTGATKVLYDLLFRASAKTLLEVARDPRHLGADAFAIEN
jgi:hypothetical protein